MAVSGGLPYPIEQLQKFSGLEVQGMEPIWRKEKLSRIVSSQPWQSSRLHYCNLNRGQRPLQPKERLAPCGSPAPSLAQSRAGSHWTPAGGSPTLWNHWPTTATASGCWRPVMAFPSQSGVAAGILGHPGGPGAPAIKATFDGSPEKLAFFLNQVWVHMDRYRLA